MAYHNRGEATPKTRKKIWEKFAASATSINRGTLRPLPDVLSNEEGVGSTPFKESVDGHTVRREEHFQIHKT